VINLKNEIKELSEEYTRYQLMSQGLMMGLSSSEASEYSMSEHQSERNEHTAENTGENRTDSVGINSEEVRKQIEYDKALLRAHLMAESMFKGCDKIHQKHMNTVSSKFHRSKMLQDEKRSRVNYRA
jgi:hypothetical protein